MITIIQIILILFAVFAWSRAIIRSRDRSIGPAELILWSFIWVSVIITAITPSIINKISAIVGIGRAVDLAVYISIILLLYLVFRLYVIIDKQNKEITSLVREVAINNQTNKKKNKSK